MSLSVRVTKRFTFETAHALQCHDGLCASIHGHSYVLDVTLRGVPRVEPGHPKDGMVVDFADLKQVVKRAVVDRYDHTLLLHEADTAARPSGEAAMARVRLTPWQPTCENMLLDIVHTLRQAMADGMELCHVRLQETATSWAEWSAADGR
jgi:6-pyruvoyltetrahydropterin/6-carboxytetrahydropterin synthase